MMKRIITAIVTLALSGVMYGQAITDQEALKELKKVMQAYRNAPELSFDVSYYYADEKKPGIYLDSLRGSCKMKGSNYWTMVDGTETLYSSGYVVVLYKADMIMYLAKPAAASIPANPMAPVDSFLAGSDQYNCTMIQEKNEKRIIIDFKEIDVYKRIEYFIDKKSGLINRMLSTVKSDQMYDPAVRSQIAEEGGYAVVEMRFGNYRQNGMDEKIFDTGRYFKKEESGYVTLPPYDAYKIFIGTPNL